MLYVLGCACLPAPSQESVQHFPQLCMQQLVSIVCFSVPIRQLEETHSQHPASSTLNELARRFVERQVKAR